jgi:HSP20 family molecular chaperone IbpA
MWAEACAMIERADRLHREFFRPGSATAPVANWEPPLDIFESEGQLWIIVALPGVEPQDLGVSVDGDLLSIAGARRLPASVRGAAIRRLEIPHGRFERSIRLPPGRFALGRSELASGCLVLSLTKQV